MSTYSPKFLTCVRFVIHEEGGFVNDPTDPGGATKYGISMRSHCSDIGDIDGDGDIDAEDVRLITVEQAMAIYFDEYWGEIRGEELPTPMALVMLDTAVNCGEVRAIKLLQRAGGLVEDGRFGRATMSWALAPTALHKMLTKRKAFYAGLRTFKKYGKGWLARVSRLEITAAELASSWKVAA